MATCFRVFHTTIHLSSEIVKIITLASCYPYNLTAIPVITQAATTIFPQLLTISMLNWRKILVDDVFEIRSKIILMVLALYLQHNFAFHHISTGSKLTCVCQPFKIIGNATGVVTPL
ncbi:hypothetical protein CVS40_6286 [Lucilia cuprina]|nr:hypothetical protein CVS40_6286 [Lucilia cuprina]